MTTTTSSTSTASTSSAASIVQTLGSGSGIDITSLVSSLVAAQYAAKNSQLSSQADTLTAQISGIASVKSGITGFSSAFNTLVTGGSLTTQPSSSNSAVLTATAQSGAKLAGLSATMVVKQLAQAQAATTNAAIPASTVFNTGSFSLQFGSDPTDANGITTFTAGSSSPISITIGSDDATLAGIAAKINAAHANVTATVIADGDGQRLSIKGATGQSQAFTLTGTDDSSSTGSGSGGTSLATLNVGRDATGTTIGTGAQDAVMTLDGATFTRSSNTVNNLISGVRLTLTGTSTTPVTIGNTPPTSALSSAVGDIVDTFNQVMATLKTQTDPVTGVLKSDSAVTGIARSLGVLTTTKLATPSSPGGPSTLAEIGVKTNKDGTLSVDSLQLASALANHPADVEALFALGTGTGTTGNGFYAALNAIATTATNTTYGLDAATTRYTAQQTKVTSEQADQTAAAADAKTRMTQQFSAMDAKVAAYKSTQSFLTQQIAAWTKTDS